MVHWGWRRGQFRILRFPLPRNTHLSGRKVVTKSMPGSINRMDTRGAPSSSQPPSGSRSTWEFQLRYVYICVSGKSSNVFLEGNDRQVERHSNVFSFNLISNTACLQNNATPCYLHIVHFKTKFKWICGYCHLPSIEVIVKRYVQLTFKSCNISVRQFNFMTGIQSPSLAFIVLLFWTLPAMWIPFRQLFSVVFHTNRRFDQLKETQRNRWLNEICMGMSFQLINIWRQMKGDFIVYCILYCIVHNVCYIYYFLWRCFLDFFVEMCSSSSSYAFCRSW